MYPCLEDKHGEKNRELCKCVNSRDETKKDIGRELYNDAGRLTKRAKAANHEELFLRQKMLLFCIEIENR